MNGSSNITSAIVPETRILAVSPIIPTFMDDEVRNAWMRDDEPPERTTGRRMTPGGFKTFEHQ
jgi:isopenicillin-N epimerase